MSYERVGISDENWAFNFETGLWLKGRPGDVYKTDEEGYLFASEKGEDHAVPPPASTWEWDYEWNSPGWLGDGSYVDLHPTRHTYREDVEVVARYLVDNYDCYVNTYVDHPPGWGLDTVSIDIWGPDGRGDPIWNGNGAAGFWDIFNNGNPPWIRWCIADGYIWDDWYGWRPFWETDVWSDAQHRKHYHITFW